MAKKKAIVLPARKKQPVNSNQCVKISAKAYNYLVDLYNESSLCMSDLVSNIVIQAVENGIIELEKVEGDE